MDVTLRLTGDQLRELRSHLHPGDGKEAVAFLLCGRRAGEAYHVLCGKQVVPVPYASCHMRTPHTVKWDSRILEDILREQYGTAAAIVKFHSHPPSCTTFSRLDDESDAAVFQFVHSYLEDGHPHASVILTADGHLVGRILLDGEVKGSLRAIVVAGTDIQFVPSDATGETRGLVDGQRTDQAFGAGTTKRFQRMRFAVVGCSGTGSLVAEQLVRLGAGRVVLIDDDVIEDKNLGRILNATKSDIGEFKVSLLARKLGEIGLGTDLLPLAKSVLEPSAVLAVAECDVVFGCVDGAEGRHMINRIATFYTQPLIDVGVSLEADGLGGIDAITGAVNYIQPGASSLYSRRVYTMKQVEAEALRRSDPAEYEQRRKAGYLKGVVEDRPAVISINMVYAGLAVTEFLARLHPFRVLPNREFAWQALSLTEAAMYHEPEGMQCAMLKGNVGRGDTVPLLLRPDLS